MINNLRNGEFDLLIIGGGITGTTIARDAAFRGLSVCLLEKNDFASGTSSMTSKMIHGGLRYLANYEFRLVREAALERKVAISIAPHIAEPTEFIIPRYKWNKEGRLFFKLGLIAYDLLSIPKRIGKHKMLSKKQLVKKFPSLDSDELVGGASYYDVKTDDSRWTMLNALSSIARSKDQGVSVLNYMEVTNWEDDGDEIHLETIDKLTGEKFSVTSGSLIISGGPWTEQVEALGKNFDGKAKLRLTRGTHILIDKKIDDIQPCLAINHDGRPIFVIPRLNGKILAGTTDVDYSGDPSDVVPTKEDVEYILQACNKIFPNISFSKKDILASFAGVRPLVYKKGVKEGKVSRNHSIFVKGNVVTVLGGKLTTARIMAKETLDILVKDVFKEKIQLFPCLTHKFPIFSGEIENWDEYLEKQTQRLISIYGFDKNKSEMLVKWYGSELDYFELILKDHGSQELPESSPWLEAQVVYSCRVEQIQSPIDFLRRRTPIMLEKGNGIQCLDRTVEIMASELAWSDEQKVLHKQESLKYIKKYINFD